MNRNQCNLYINNISDRTNEDYLISYFSQFGKIESYTFFPKIPRRKSAAAIFTYHFSVDINKIIKNNQKMNLNGYNLYLRRTLPINRPAYERFMSSSELLVSLKISLNTQQFNEINLRKYFRKYGSIVSCRIVIPYTTYLIDFVDTNSVDTAIIDEPHFFNDNELVLRKYVSPNHLEFFNPQRFFSNPKNRKIKLSLFEKFRRFKHITEAYQFGHQVELKVIKRSYEEKILKYNEEIKKILDYIRKKSNDIKENIEKIKIQNQSLKLMIEQNQRIRKYIMDLSKSNIENEQNRINELKKTIESLNFS